MIGYRWDPVFRVVPVNGSETVYWLADRLTDVGSHTRINLRYVTSSNVREDINRSLRPVVYGLRPEVDIECLIWTMADQQFIAEIESALLDTLYYSVYLSLDGGCVYRQVVLADVSNAEPISGKTVVGARFTLKLRCVDLIARKPIMATDPAVGMELLPDGGLESWTSGSAMQAWTASGAVTLAQEATIIAAGTYSAKFTRTDGGSVAVFNPTTSITTFQQGRWYRFRGKVRGTIAFADAVRFRIFNSTQSLAVDSDGKTWSGSSGNLILKASITGSFDSLEAYFRFPASYVYGNSISPRFQGLWTGTESMYYDDLSVFGPVLRPGVATW